MSTAPRRPGDQTYDGLLVQDDLPAGCAGRSVAITYSSHGTVVRQAVRPLQLGVVDRVDRSAVGDVVVTAASWAPVR